MSDIVTFESLYFHWIAILDILKRKCMIVLIPWILGWIKVHWEIHSLVLYIWMNRHFSCFVRRSTCSLSFVCCRLLHTPWLYMGLQFYFANWTAVNVSILNRCMHIRHATIKNMQYSIPSSIYIVWLGNGGCLSTMWNTFKWCLIWWSNGS